MEHYNIKITEQERQWIMRHCRNSIAHIECTNPKKTPIRNQLLKDRRNLLARLEAATSPENDNG